MPMIIAVPRNVVGRGEWSGGRDGQWSGKSALQRSRGAETRLRRGHGPGKYLGADHQFKPKVQAVSFPGEASVFTDLTLGNFLPLEGCKISVRFPNQ